MSARERVQIFGSYLRTRFSRSFRENVYLYAYISAVSEWYIWGPHNIKKLITPQLHYNILFILQYILTNKAWETFLGVYLFIG